MRRTPSGRRAGARRRRSPRAGGRSSGLLGRYRRRAARAGAGPAAFDWIVPLAFAVYACALIVTGSLARDRTTVAAGAGAVLMVALFTALILSPDRYSSPRRACSRRCSYPAWSCSGPSRAETMAENPFDHSGLDDVIHARIRLGVVAYLASVDSALFSELRDKVGATDGNLSAHVGKLEEAGYVSVAKSFVGRKPQTRLALTPLGRRAWNNWLDRIEQLARAAGAPTSGR